MDKLLDFFDHLLNRKKTEASCPSYQYIRLTVRKFIESSGNGTGKYMMMSSRYTNFINEIIIIIIIIIIVIIIIKKKKNKAVGLHYCF